MLRAQERIMRGLATAAKRNVLLRDQAKAKKDRRNETFYEGVYTGIRMSLFVIVQTENPSWLESDTWDHVNRIIAMSDGVQIIR